MPFIVLGLVLVVRFVTGLNYVGNILLAVGWGIGYLLAEADHFFYVLVCNPQELSCQRVRSEIDKRQWKNAWGLLQKTAGERIRMPIHNVLTGLIVVVMAIWIVTSSGSLLASGVAVGLSVRLLIEFWQVGDFRKWYWLFAREFSVNENKIVKWVWSGLTILCCIFLLR